MICGRRGCLWKSQTSAGDDDLVAGVELLFPVAAGDHHHRYALGDVQVVSLGRGGHPGGGPLTLGQLHDPALALAAHEGAVALAYLDEPLTAQQAERLADRLARHAVLVLEI